MDEIDKASQISLGLQGKLRYLKRMLSSERISQEIKILQKLVFFILLKELEGIIQ